MNINNIYFWVVFLLAGSAVTAFLSILFWKRRNVPGALACSLFMIAVTLYSFGYAFEIMSNNLETIKFWLRIEYLGISFIPFLWLVIALQYTNNDNYVNRRLMAVLLFLSVVTLFSHYTNELHHLFYRDISLEAHHGLVLANLERGPLYWIYICYAFVSYMVAAWLYLKMYVKSIQTVRKQILFMLIGTLPVLVLAFFYQAGFTRNVDVIPFSSLFAGVFFFLGFFRFQLFKINPIVLEKVVYSMQDGVIILNAGNHVITCNDAAKRIFPELDQLRNGHESVDKVMHDYPRILDLIKNGENNVSIELEMTCCGKERYYEASFSMIIHRDRIIGKIIILKDITEKQELLIRLNEAATTDALTGLYNRRFFNEAFEKELLRSKRYGRPLSLILLDIDHFKNVNDTYGHQTGDLVLKNVAEILSACLRAGDILARYGGEEFIVLLPETPEPVAVGVAERIRLKLSGSVLEVDGARIQVTASFGVCGTDAHDSNELSGLLTRVDNALYRAKSQGRNLVKQ